MATYVLKGFGPNDFKLVSGYQFRIDPGWDAQRDARIFTITDDDSGFAGDASNGEQGDDSTQSAVVTDAHGNTLASGRVYIEDAFTLADEFGVAVTVYTVEIGGRMYGGLTSGQLQPGNTYTVTSAYGVSGSNQPDYSAMSAATYDQDGANDITGTGVGDSLSGGEGADTIDGGGGADTIIGGQGADTISGGAGDDTIYGGDEPATSIGGSNTVGETWTAIRLGNAADIDPDESDANSEDAAALLGTWGGVGEELYRYTVTVSGSDSNNDGHIGDNDSNATAETITIDGYGTSIDSAQTYNATVTFTDGSTGSVSVVVFQTVGGVVYLAPELSDNADNVLLTSKPIQSITLDSVLDDTVVLVDDRVDADYAQPGDTDASADTIDGGAGDDTIYFGAGDDTVRGGDGNDTIDDEAGTRLAGTNLLDGGSGDDTIYAGQGDDTVYGGSGDDTIWGEEGSNWIAGGSGADTITGADGSDTIHGDFESGGLRDPGARFAYEFYELDAISLTSLADAGFDGASNVNLPDDQGAVDTIDVSRIAAQHGTDLDTFAVKFATTLTVTTGGTYTFTLSGDDGARIFVGGVEIVGHDGLHSYSTVSASTPLAGGEHAVEIVYFENTGDQQLGVTLAGPDTGGVAVALEDAAIAADFDDTIVSGGGADTIEGGLGSDILTGGADGDTFVFSAGSGSDTITDFDLDDDDHDGFTNDQIDVSGLHNTDGSPVRTWDVATVDDGSGNAMLLFPNGETIVLQGVAPSEMQTGAQYHSAGIPCFTAGTLIRTTAGAVPVESLRPGDLVVTRDGGPRPLVWAAYRRLGPAELRRAPHLKPVTIAPGTFGNERALTVSPQHGLLLRHEGEELLVRAKHLADLPGGAARRMAGCRSVTYCHLLFERHEVVFSNGVPSESYYPGPGALAGLSGPARRELNDLFPDLARITGQRDVARHFGKPARNYSKRSRLPDHLRGFAPAP